ncbi:NAD(P)-dependent dehydrogenase (short-subunit alcohol dehydrogenase family) [Pseudomonas citronellolis]|uniref:SDR family oxidoreductase n=1 Tax=Pseudomonas citronellolis TaxID=53408 RepID=UPI00209EDDA2|nr:SDR family oxidoreductase [Pseudomonas citronellolis]MCP1640654.1 NAD(P)-dependent dehydrogenase (short-subunit alcohol dehydrogenase family) [Pseudomonas citronellolis]MCP1663574.1 NAD(P)-dependent dehydrogenase (short-subunit alcohol dehydrogenase family) [Pseudomonas citronellolis]MCP1696124.1 NAD(P)-dependent dehydrogenase (short-subunit alcohol dehydrogenase family) [Pseudomonas citronellolis]MCP1701615.1 NAD(P)-dependent dehydrogenase (short-subunit alcohol dehydrogenase family) [Pseud
MPLCKARTVIITGAGGGLGRAYALALAAEGANVVVNDINREAVAGVVALIRDQGGNAIGDCHDITDYAEAGEIVQAAIAAFGDLHAVVNNAGICRDRMFASLTEADWDAVMNVHLKGHFCIASHAVRHWREQVKQGAKVQARLINTSSGAGLQGSIGQSNYSAAKGGIAALTLVQAAELARYGITANALAPAARTGMTEQVFAEVMKKPEAGFDHFAPENVAPLVAWLVSEASQHVSGRLFEVEGGKLSIADGWRRGPERDKGARWLPEEIGEAVDALIDRATPPQKVYGA